MSIWHPIKPAYPIQDNAYDLGSPTLRWKDAYLAQRLYFGANEYLYRSTAGILRTPNGLIVDGTLGVGSNLTAGGYGNLNSLLIGNTEIITSDKIVQNIPEIRGGWLSPQYLGARSDSAAYIWFRTKNIAGTSTLDHKFCPSDANYGFLGDSTYYWYQVYASFIDSYSIKPKDGDNTGYLGNSTLRWGYLYAVNKNAAFKHPLHNPERYIVFKCTESPKVTVEDWGVAELKNGVAFVGLSEEFVALMSDKIEYAVFLTPEGECNGLYVSKKEFYGFEVRELKGGKSNTRFSWQVKAVRIGDEATPVLEEPTPKFTSREEELKWAQQRQEADRQKEEHRLKQMQAKIEKYRKTTKS